MLIRKPTKKALFSWLVFSFRGCFFTIRQHPTAPASSFRGGVHPSQEEKVGSTTLADEVPASTPVLPPQAMIEGSQKLSLRIKTQFLEIEPLDSSVKQRDSQVKPRNLRIKPLGEQFDRFDHGN